MAQSKLIQIQKNGQDQSAKLRLVQEELVAVHNEVKEFHDARMNEKE